MLALLSGVGVGPRQRAYHRCALPEGAASDEVVEIEFQSGLDRGFSAVVATARAAHLLSRLYEILC